MESYSSVSTMDHQNQSFLCQAGNKIFSVCYDKNCKQCAFVCQNKKCQCRSKHKDCIRLEVEQVKKAILQKTISIEPFVKKFDEMIEKSIDELSILRQLTINQFKEKYEYALLTQKEKDFLVGFKNGSIKDINCSFMWQINKSLIEERKQVIKIEDYIKKFETIWNIFHNEITEMKRKVYHEFKLNKNEFFNKQENLVIDKYGWIRVMKKIENEITTEFRGILTEDDINKMKIVDIGWSDNVQTMNTPESWYINKVTFETNTKLPINKVVANVFNGKTPTGDDWTDKYEGGLLYYKGMVQTYGHFNSFYMGWQWKAHIEIGTYSSLRSGGHPSHTGEWIHSNCNGYSEKEHSITSRIGWKNNRVFWVRCA